MLTIENNIFYYMRMRDRNIMFYIMCIVNNRL